MRYGLRLLYFTLGTALMSPMIVAAERQPVSDGDEDADSPKRHNAAEAELTYAGRNLEAWRALSLNDLDPATRAQAFKAFVAFAHHGCATESHDAITSALSKEKSLIVLREGYVAAKSLREDGLSILVDGLRHKDRRHQQAACEAFANYSIAVNDDAVTAMIDILRAGDAKMRKHACRALYNMSTVTEFDFSDMRHPVRLRPQGEYGPITRRVVSALAAALKDEDSSVRVAAAASLGRTGRGASAATDDLVAYLNAAVGDLLTSDKRNTRTDPRDKEVSTAIQALTRIRGPGASGAIPALKKLAEQEQRYRRSVDEAIRAINGDS